MVGMAGDPAAPTPAARFLELLAAEAPVEEFERVAVAARQAGGSAAELAAVERDRLVALRVRALLEHRRRREAELSGLFDTASDLARLRDVDEVLRAIARRARTLLGADVAYLTLHDPERGDTYMRVTDGSISARFQALRLPMGAGLGGLVAQTARPYATADYLSDPRFDHQDEIDAGVREEGLVAILGVPLQLGERVLGVLFAANRSPRPFHRQEVALLVSLGAHAAVALDSARRLAETRAALAELSAANETIRAHSADVERAAAAHDRMTAVVLRGGGVEDVAAVVTEVLGGGLVVLEPDGRPLASVGPSPAVTWTPEELAAAVATARASERGVHPIGVGPARRWVAAVAAGGEDLGALIWAPPVDPDQPAGEISESDQRILGRAAVVTALLLLFRRSVTEAENRVRGELLDDLVRRPGQDLAGLRDRARRLGVDLDSRYVVVVADFGPGSTDRCGAAGELSVARARAGFWAASHASRLGGLAAGRGERLVLLLPGDDPAEAAQEVVTQLSQVLDRPVTAGAAGPAAGAARAAATYAEAERCLTALLALGRVGSAGSAAELGFIGLLLGRDTGEPVSGAAVRRFVTTTLGPVLEYDQRRGTALLTTLEEYFAAGGSLVRAAARLHVHVNTVSQRLERVGRLLGPGWHRPDRAVELQLALRLHRLSSHSPSDPGRPAAGW